MHFEFTRRTFVGTLGTSAAALAAGAAGRASPATSRPAVGTEKLLNAKDFGASGDGATDDTAAMEKALAAMTPDGTLVIPPGQYRVTRPLHVRRLSRFRITGAGHPTALVDDAPMAALLVVEYPALDGLIDYLTLDAACKADVALRYEGGYAFFLDRVVIRRPRTLGIDVGDPSKYWGNEFVVTNCYLTGVRETQGEGDPSQIGIRVVNLSDCMFATSLIRGFADAGIHISGGDQLFLLIKMREQAR